MKKKVFAAFALVAWLAGAPFAYADGKYVAASYSDRFHRADCKIVNKIDKEDIVTFSTPEEAIAAGFVPCKKCNPPVSSKKS
jgi:methylphosphotriester-DNA--protein-cysteine methyltransferase